MGLPLLERNFRKLKDFGIADIVLSTCYKPDYIKNYFGDGTRLGLSVNYVKEDIPLGTGGAIKNSEQYFKSEPFLIFNADIICDIDFADMAAFHREKHADVTIAAVSVVNPSAYGVIEYDSDDFAVTFREKPKPSEIVSHYINAGVYMFNPEVLKHIPSGRTVSVEREVFPGILESGGKIAVYRKCDYWLDIGTPKKYMQAHMDAFKGLYKIEEADFKSNPVYGWFRSKIKGTALLKGPVYLGQNATVEAGAIIGPDAVIGAGSHIGRNCVIKNSVLWENVNVDNCVEISDSIVAGSCHVMQSSPYENMIFTGDAERDKAIS